jgi:hypothetical protein
MCFCHKDTNYCLIVAVLPNFSQFRPQNLSARHKKSQLAFANRPFLLVFQNARSVKASYQLKRTFYAESDFKAKELSYFRFGLWHAM